MIACNTSTATTPGKIAGASQASQASQQQHRNSGAASITSISPQASQALQTVSTTTPQASRAHSKHCDAAGVARATSLRRKHSNTATTAPASRTQCDIATLLHLHSFAIAPSSFPQLLASLICSIAAEFACSSQLHQSAPFRPKSSTQRLLQPVNQSAYQHKQQEQRGDEAGFKLAALHSLMWPSLEQPQNPAKPQQIRQYQPPQPQQQADKGILQHC
jgi:hypothetical protein